MSHSVETFPGDVVQLDFQNTGRRQTAQISWHIMCYKLWLKKVSTQKHQGRRQGYEQMVSFFFAKADYPKPENCRNTQKPKQSIEQKEQKPETYRRVTQEDTRRHGNGLWSKIWVEPVPCYWKDAGSIPLVCM